MARLMLRCPMTDRNFATGINTDRESLTRIPGHNERRALSALWARSSMETQRRMVGGKHSPQRDVDDLPR